MPVSARAAQAVHTECDYMDVDVATDSTIVFNGPCIYYGSIVTTVLSAHALPIMDDTVPIDIFPASSAIGSRSLLPNGVKCYTKLVVEADNSGTGHVTVFYRPLNV